MAVEYEGARYYRQFIKQLRELEDGRLEDLEEGEYDIYVDKKLGLKLYHAGINPRDQDHYRHVVYIVILAQGKAGRLSIARKRNVVASILSLQYSSTADVCEALLRSVDKNGKRAVAGRPIASEGRCGECGHDMEDVYAGTWECKNGAFCRGHSRYEKCCKFDSEMEKFRCCACDLGYPSPIDTAKVRDLPDDTPIRLRSQTPRRPTSKFGPGGNQSQRSLGSIESDYLDDDGLYLAAGGDDDPAHYGNVTYNTYNIQNGYFAVVTDASKLPPFNPGQFLPSVPPIRGFIESIPDSQQGSDTASRGDNADSTGNAGKVETLTREVEELTVDEGAK